MKFKEFLEYLENNLDGYGTFLRKARQFQAGQNAKRKNRGLIMRRKKLPTKCGQLRRRACIITCDLWLSRITPRPGYPTSRTTMFLKA